MIFTNLTRCVLRRGPLPNLSYIPNSYIPPSVNLAQTAVLNLSQLEKRANFETTNICNFFINEMNRLQGNQQNIDSNSKTDQLIHRMLMALQSGNIDMAMLIFSSLETNQSHQITQLLGQKLLDAQNQRRQLTSQLAGTQGQNNSNSGQMTQLQSNMQEVNDSIQMLTTFIKDIQDQKNRTVEFANNFLNSEHQTTMSIVRGMRG